MAALCLASCDRNDGNRRPGNNSNNNHNNTPGKVEYIDNPNWTITYTGREVDTQDGVYVVDPVYLKSSDKLSYFLDVISASDYKSKYGSSIVKFIEDNFKNNFQKDWVVSGDSRTPFDALDAGDGSWVAVAYEITSDGKLGTKYSYLEFKTKAITMREDKSYGLSYDGRGFWEDGSEVENFSVKAYSDYSYYVDIAYPEYISENYDGDPVNFFNDVLDNLASGMNDLSEFADVIYEGNQSFAFDKLRHGDWTVYAFGVDYLGNLTGNWSKFNFNIEEEEATEAFKKWLGTWAIGGKGGGVDEKGKPISGEYFYNITITSAENNEAFAIEDWETGNSSSEFANKYAKDYIFEAGYDRASGNLIFKSQYLGSAEDDEIGVYDACFLGNVNYGKETWAITDIDAPIADAIMAEDGKSAKVEGQHVTVNIDKQKYTTEYVSMQFYDVTDDGIYDYNDAIPYFPMTMTKLSGPSSVCALSTVSRKLPARKATTAKSIERHDNADNVIRRSAPGNETMGKPTRRTAVKPASSVATKAPSISVSASRSGAHKSSSNKASIAE